MAMAGTERRLPQVGISLVPQPTDQRQQDKSDCRENGEDRFLGASSCDLLYRCYEKYAFIHTSQNYRVLRKK